MAADKIDTHLQLHPAPGPIREARRRGRDRVRRGRGSSRRDEARRICIWTSNKGPLFVTLPAKPGKGGHYFDSLSLAKPGNGTVKALKEQILRQWEAIQAAEVSVA